MWRIDYIIPNFEINETFENDHFAIASIDDSRVQEVMTKNNNASIFIKSFRDQFHNEIKPSLFLSKTALPNYIKSIEAIVGFRNILAISKIIRSHEITLFKNRNELPPFSEHFDFYDYSFSKDQNEILVDTPGVGGLVFSVNQFAGQTTPGLAKYHVELYPEKDILQDSLMQIWGRRYENNKLGEWKTKTIFRALEMAYLASRMPNENLTTIFDIGSKIALWVSAFEILAHPYRANVNLITVINLIESYDWFSSKLKQKRYKIRYQGSEHRVTLPSKIYKQLYDSRNIFLHGNTATLSRLKVFRKKDNALLVSVAPLIFKIALFSKICELLPKNFNEQEKQSFELNLISAFSHITQGKC